MSKKTFDDLDGNGERQPTDEDDSLYETQIQDILKKHDCIECPVIANDEIHTIKMNPTRGSLGKPTFFIMNLSDRDSKEGGTHWTAVWIDKYDCIYFDSFGREPEPETVEGLKKLCETSYENVTMRKFKHNKKLIQDIDSSDCGYFCINFIERMCNGMSFKEATNFTEEDVQRLVDKTEKYI